MFKKQRFREQPVVVAASVGVSGKPKPWKAARLAEAARNGRHVLHEPIMQTAGNKLLLGVKLLRHFCATFDRKNALVRLERERKEPITMEPLRSTGVGLRRGTDRWSIWQNFPYADAAARELRTGDIVTQIESKPVAEYECTTFSELSVTRDATDMRIQRGNRELSVTLPVIEIAG